MPKLSIVLEPKPEINFAQTSSAKQNCS